ncbi:hypothetical protein AC578_8245 [Pseudocercospora eumusae]|uniref:feruloyl esterase n=1 Tax=Pseudocercospora eumusae TaxID=321146 RepID=A0A139HE64_9PEZI|nr:hypothetical protein AC578_8245 [Pseudocercospora eumusae]
MVVLTRYIGLVCVLIASGRAAKTAGCGKALAGGITTGGTGQSNNVSITSNGIKRSYLLHLPKAYSANSVHGLILSFHGRGESGAKQEKVSRFSVPTVNPHMIVAYPNGINNQWQGDPAATTDDIGFTMDMIKQISNSYCVDDAMIYATGKSNGGGFAANILACDPNASKRIAAFGGFAGAYYVQDGKQVSSCDGGTYPVVCKPGRKPIPIFETHGSKDGVIPYPGGARRTKCLPSVPHFMTEWSKRNGLGSTNVSTTLAGGKVVKYEYGSKNGLNGINTHYSVSGLRHQWPDTVANGDGCCSYINASMLFLDWAKRWTLSATPSTAVSVSSNLGSPIKSTSTAGTKTTIASASPSKYPSPSCPGANGTVWKTPEGTKFNILCGFDTTASVYDGPIYNLKSFGKCIKACKDDTACEHVVYTGACYLKKAVKGLAKKSSNVNRVAIKSG